jgi:hypothetical protein
MRKSAGPCPFHGAASDAACGWCSLAWYGSVLPAVRTWLYAHVRRHQPDAVIEALAIAHRSGDALWVDAEVTAAAGTFWHRFLVRPNGRVQELG